MSIKHLRRGYGSSCFIACSLFLFASCKRDILTTPDTGSTLQRAVTSTGIITGRPTMYPIQMAQVTSQVGKPNSSMAYGGTGVAADAAGNIYVVSQYQSRVYEFTSTGAYITYWGSSIAGFKDGSPTTAEFNQPSSLIVGADGKIYVTDLNNNRIRVISADHKQVTTLAGNGTAAYKDGTGTGASFNKPAGVTVDASGNVYVADYGNNMIRKVTPSGVVSSVAGQTSAGSKDGTGGSASFNGPQGITIDGNGTLYVADINNHKIRKIVNGTVSTLAGSGQPGWVDATGTAAKFSYPSAVFADVDGNVYVAEQGNNGVRRVTPAGVVTYVAGGRTAGYNDSYDINAQFAAPTGIAIDPSGNILVADHLNNVIRKVVYTPAVRTLAGNGQSGYKEGAGTNAIIDGPYDMTMGKDGNLYIMDNAERIRRITPGGVTSFVAGSGVAGFKDGPAAQAQFGAGSRIAVAADGTIYIGDQQNAHIRKLSNGVVSTIATLYNIDAITVDFNGDVLVGVTDGLNGRVDRFSPAGVSKSQNSIDRMTDRYGSLTDLAVDQAGHQWVLTHWIGNASDGSIAGQAALIKFDGDNQFPTVALNYVPAGFTMIGDTYTLPSALTATASGKLFFSPGGYILNSWIPDPQQSFTQMGGELGAGGQHGYVDAPVFEAQFTHINRVAISPSGVLYIADQNKIRMMTAQ